MLHNQYQLVNNLHPNSIQMEGYIYIDVEVVLMSKIMLNNSPR